MVGDTKIESSKDLTGKRKLSSFHEGYVYENNSYYDSGDLEIIKLISDNWDKSVTVRLYGKDYYKDISLGEQEKFGIKQTYELYKFLQEE